jgi:hypothetical protein
MRSHAVIASGLYLVLAVAETWPLAIHLHERIPHDPGDPLLIAYLLDWNSRVPPFSEAWWHPPFFWPVRDTITFSEPFVGLAPVAWFLSHLGANAAAVYNVLLIAALWLTPVAAYVLAHALTRDAAASFIAGLAFGYAPYRAAQLSHLQLLMVPALPLVLLALHRAVATGRARWVAMAAACWLWQALTSLYFLLFIPLTVALWLAWFAGFRARVTVQTIAAFAIAALLALPLIAGYRASHDRNAFTRDYREVIKQSADVSDLAFASPDLAVSATPPAKTGIEHNLFPGFAILALVALALSAVPYSTRPFRPVTIWLLALFALASVAAAIAIVHPIQMRIAGVDISLTSPHKSMSIAWIALGGAVLTSRTVSGGWHERSITLGYALVALALWILSLGPEPAIAGTQIWYRSPYSLLYEHVPGFDGLRVPARLWTIVTLCLAVIGGIGARRILRGRWRPAIAAALAAAIVIEGSIALHFDPLPHAIAVPAEAELVLELPAGRPFEDSVAMYRSLTHGRPVLNGYSGYQPASYRRLLGDIENGDAAAIVAAAAGKPIAVVINAAELRSAPIYDAVQHRAASCTHGLTVVVCLLRP